MARETFSLIDELAAVSWLTAAGQPVSIPEADAPYVEAARSWSDAVYHILYGRGQEACLASSADLASAVTELLGSADAYDALMAEARREADALVADKLTASSLKPEITNAIADSCRWSIAHAAIGVCFPTVPGASLYYGISDWFLRGHFACATVNRRNQAIILVY